MSDKGKPEKTLGQKKRQEERRRERRLVLRLQPVYVDDPGGNWSARIPQGEGWTRPTSEGDLNGDIYNPLYRTTVYGPDGFVVVDTSPSEDPVANPDNFTVRGRLLESEEIDSGEFSAGRMIAYKNGETECSGSPCARAMLSDGQGGGITVWVKAESLKQAKTIARTFAETAEREY